MFFFGALSILFIFKICGDFQDFIAPSIQQEPSVFKNVSAHTHSVSMDGKITTYPHQYMKLDIVMTDHQR
jgi:hypothetical protein